MNMEHIIQDVAEKLQAAGLYLGLAESCSGGLACAYCTSRSGSSAWFKGGVVAYANEIKQNLLDVPAALIEAEGAVSEPVVQAMVEGAWSRLDVPVAASISGIAGPEGGGPGKPVGTVWLAAGIKQGEKVSLITQKNIFPGTRDEIRHAAAKAALEMVNKLLDELE